MKAVAVARLLLLGAAPSCVWATEDANPLSKVIDLLGNLAGKIVKDGELEVKAFEEYTGWCRSASQNANFAVDLAKKQKASLEARISERGSEASVASSKIEELASALATNEEDVKKATAVRKKGAADFVAAEKELTDSLASLTSAIDVLEKELAKNPSALAQVGETSSAAFDALSRVLDAASLGGAGTKALQSLLQQQAQGEDGGPPTAAPYSSQSGSVLEVLEDMKEKAEGQLSDLRKAEVESKHNYEMMKQSLEAQHAADTSDMEKQKAAKLAAEEDKAKAQGELEMTTKDLADSTKELGTSREICLRTAADHEATVAARTEELNVIAEAKKMLLESTSGAVEQTYGEAAAASFLQVARSSGSSAENVAMEHAVQTIRSLARAHHSGALAQLASKVASAEGLRDPFKKVTDMVKAMISKLEAQAQSEATEKAYCDEETKKTEAKLSELDEEVGKMSSQLDGAAAKSSSLKEEVAALEKELAKLASEQASMDKIRQEQHSDYLVAKADLEDGLKGVRGALRKIRDYYPDKMEASASFAQTDSFMGQPAPPVKFEKATDASSGIIGLLTVCEGDFAKNLAKEETQEADSAANYEKMTQENKVTKVSKSQDVKFKTQESKSLDATVAEVSSDRENSNAELTAVKDYDAKIKERCVAKPESYEERQEKRASEIKGLKEALSTLEEETALVQRSARAARYHLRGQFQLRADAVN